MRDKYEYSAKVLANEMLDIPLNTQVRLYLQDDTFIMQANSHTYKIAIDKIIKADIGVEEQQITESKSPILRAIVGGLILCWLYPPFGILTGAIVGAISGIGHRDRIQADPVLRVSFINKEYYGQTFTFSPTSMLFDSRVEILIRELNSKLPENTTVPVIDDKIIEL